MLLTDLLRENIETYGEYNLFYYEDNIHTNVESEQMARRVSAMISALGVEQDDRILVCMPNCPEVIYSYQGILRAGAIVVPVMYLLHEKEINFILENSEAKAIITSSETLDKIVDAANGLKTKPIVICVDRVEKNNIPPELKVVEWEKAISQIDITNEKNPDRNENDVAVILYTSGTTGQPKGVMLTHKNLYSNAANGASLRENDDQGTTLGILPLAHIYGFGIMNSCLMLGSSVVIFPKFDVEEVFKAIETHKVKTFAAVPAMIHAMVHSPLSESYDLTSLEKVGSGSTALPVSLINSFYEKFNAELRDGYGLSEASPTVASQRNDRPVKAGSVGITFPGVETKIVDEDGNELPPGEIGELLVKGDNVTPGYFRNEEATREALKDGWLHTGDMAKFDEDGYLFIVDRKKDLIIRGGFNLYPRDLEELLSKHEAVSEVAVIGVPSESLGEEVLACIVLKPGRHVTEEELIAYSQTHLAKYKTPRQVLFVDQLPRNGVGKILKVKLKEMYADHRFHT